MRDAARSSRRGSRIIERMIPTPSSQAPIRLRRLPDRVADARAIDAAEAFRDLPGLVLLESARPGRNARWTYLTADPVAVLESPAAGPDPFAVARRLVARLDRTVGIPADAPPFPRRVLGLVRDCVWGGPVTRPSLHSRGCPRSLRRIRTFRRCDSRCTIGSSPGTGGQVTRRSAAEPSTAMGAASHAGLTTSTHD